MGRFSPSPEIKLILFRADLGLTTNKASQTLEAVGPVSGESRGKLVNGQIDVSVSRESFSESGLGLQM